MTLEPNPLLNETNDPISQAQDRHIEQFNRLGKVIASCPDYYALVKSGDKKSIASVQKDLDESAVIVGDRTFYNGNSLDARIVSYYGSKVVQPAERTLFVPDYSNYPTLSKVLATEQGLIYIQLLLNTTDSADEIKNTLSMLSGKNSRQTRIWTPDQDGRRFNPIRGTALFYDLDNIFKIGSTYLELEGRAREVHVNIIEGAVVKKAS